MATDANPLLQILTKLGLGAGQGLQAGLFANNPRAGAFYQHQQDQAQQQTQWEQEMAMQQGQSEQQQANWQKQFDSQQADQRMRIGSAITSGWLTPDDNGSISFGGKKYAPMGYQAPTTYSIDPTDEDGKILNLNSPWSTTDPEEFMGVKEWAAEQKLAQGNKAAQDALLQKGKTDALGWIDQRFNPNYSMQLYGKPDPSLDVTRKKLQDEVNSITTLAGLNQWHEKTNKFETDGESFLRKEKEQKDLLELHRQDQNNTGTWSLMEDNTGKPILFNSKTGQTQDANGIQKSGTAAKQDAATAPIQGALNYANLYAKSNNFTGPSDEALLEKYFELAKPEHGFRMSDTQIKLLKDSQSWMGSVEGKIYHAMHGTWFSPDQRQQIVKTMNDLGESRHMFGQGRIIKDPKTNKRFSYNGIGKIDDMNNYTEVPQ